MRLRAKRAARLAAAAAALALAWPALPAGPSPQAAEIEAAVATLRQDPNLGADRSIRVLRWVEKERRQTTKPASFLSTLLQWLLQALRWIAATGRAVVVVAAIILAAVLTVYLVRLFAQRQRVPRQDAGPQPAHVRGLDIRPESLPQDIGAAALALWRSGDVRGALALLYRGLLSRAVHVHDVTVKASSTEGECLALFAPRLPRAALDYAASLVRTWELAVYRGAAPEASAVEALCSGFSAALDVPAASDGGAAP